MSAPTLSHSDTQRIKAAFEQQARAKELPERTGPPPATDEDDGYDRTLPAEDFEQLPLPGMPPAGTLSPMSLDLMGWMRGNREMLVRQVSGSIRNLEEFDRTYEFLTNLCFQTPAGPKRPIKVVVELATDP